MNSLTIFFASAFISSLLIRFLADGLRLRLYIKKRKLRIFFIKRIRKMGGIHVHHFVYGIVLFVIAFALLYSGSQNTAMLFAGLSVALIASEAKELVLQKWGP